MLQPILFMIFALLIITLIIIWFTNRNTKINLFLRKASFPFVTEKYIFLEKKWWHRLLKILFLLSLLFSIWYFLNTIIEDRDYPLKSCEDQAYSSYSNYMNESDSMDRLNKVIKECRVTYPQTPSLSLLYSLLVTLIISYIVQFIYFKLIIYIIYGDIKK